jgi:hypothetical protein
MREAYEALKVVVDLDLGELVPEEQAALEKLMAMFEPYEGDAPREATKRVASYLRCSNCDHVWEGFYAPGRLEKAMNVGQRMGVCPRCYATKGIKIGGVK